ncbi:4-diphosphocytidyl-2-C-methyl-D-erythritol kinase [Synechococcus sp. CC9902]|jgi:4-diphosphocytidyl-2-C-methyl-D-erythritol kinase|uniref:4-diphosphocytidyl-2-C-methyl-D-erythritol kinase n=1 Tax=Synechococcus sp. (strain CC9902) TaxID=316279 RepID=ISPE_SYNS9|nr:4-(cytidine 5'-diphospho)-2-C-methyl-D-erythritol kinase [Synechococcus sp. CC9902]Q3AXF4.1 RecName: Full=4-diphosphocytidyl-2-C-methyl-D-erythritol kinase; Short=CMK; AltName: Full=4-(cytidine-5'-diphospho)-2-C-methyl-D-erythritol kinase [Synechococcus sp. CC9902]ABB26246.1 4-diphosphocytidyl-2-C-methyl-D-erythritol kinase [Synechococcus sp. CC9902]
MLTVTAPAKVNLHLEVLGLRSDGFHELAMVMQSIDLADSLQFTNTADAQITLRCDDSSLSTGADNLVLKAAELLRARSGFNELGVSMYLEKRIPIGAGLAGGSSDGAAALVGLNALWGLGYTAEALESMAAELGSDMPFCVAGGTQLCFGRGELLEPVPPTAEGLAVLLVKDPLVSVSTPWAYQRCKELKGKNYLEGEVAFEQRRRDLREAPWLQPLRAGCPPPLRNDLQVVVAAETQAVQVSLQLLQTLPTPLAVAMSGSGPSCFALFGDQDQCDQAAADLSPKLKAAGLKAWACSLRSDGVRIAS